MFVRFPALLAFAAVAIAVSAKPIVIRDSPITLPIARRANVTAMPNIVKADKARAQMLKARAQGAGKGVVSDGKPPFNFPVTNEASAYVASVGVGTPPTPYNLIVDTGSSNTWIGANTSYVVTPSSNDTGESIVRVCGFCTSCSLVADLDPAVCGLWLWTLPRWVRSV